MKYIMIGAVLLGLILSGCSKKDDNNVQIAQWVNRIGALYAHNAEKVSISEGIYGTVTRLSGNCMPIVDSAAGDCREEPVQRNVYIYEYTMSADADGNLGSYLNIRTQLKGILKTDAEGFFELQLPPGNYSIFTEDDGVLYADHMDDNTGINPVTVTPGTATASNQRIIKAVF